MFGPIFSLELTRERRGGLTWRLLPWAYAGLLGFQVLVAWHDATTVNYFRGVLRMGPAEIIPSKMHQFVVQHFLVLFLLTPALTATAFGEEKAKGTLAHLFTTQLTSVEIVGGKLAARSLRVAGMVLPSLPILFVVGGYSGLPLQFFVALVLVSLLVILGLGAVGLLCAVESKHTSGALLATYALVGLAMFALQFVTLPALDPLETLAPAWGRAAPRAAARSLSAAALAWLVVAGVCFALAVWRLRPDGLRQMQGDGPRREAATPNRPPVGDDPFRWRGYHVEGLAPLPLFQGINRARGVLTVGVIATGVSTYTAFQSVNYWSRYQHADPWFFLLQGLFFLIAATLIVTVRSAGAITGEREKDTWDSLRLTPLDGRTFLTGKLRGIFDSVRPYFVAYALPAALLSFTGGWLGVVVTMTSLLTVWPFMYFAAGCSLRASVRGPSTWRSLLAALWIVYGTSFLISVSCQGVIMVLFVLVNSYANLRHLGEVIVIVLGYCICAIFASLGLALFGRSQLRGAEGEFRDAFSRRRFSRHRDCGAGRARLPCGRAE